MVIMSVLACVFGLTALIIAIKNSRKGIDVLKWKPNAGGKVRWRNYVIQEESKNESIRERIEKLEQRSERLKHEEKVKFFEGEIAKTNKDAHLLIVCKDFPLGVDNQGRSFQIVEAKSKNDFAIYEAKKISNNKSWEKWREINNL